MMKTIKKICNCIFVIVMFVFWSIAEGAENDLYIDANITSKHLDGGTHNQKNLGLGLSYDYTKHIEFKLGFYDNSFDVTSVYSLTNFYYDWRKNVRLGFAVGLVSGYRGTAGEMKNFEVQYNLQAMVLPSIDLHNNEYHMIIGMLPNVLVLQLQYKIK